MIIIEINFKIIFDADMLPTTQMKCLLKSVQFDALKTYFVVLPCFGLYARIHDPRNDIPTG